MLQNEVLRKSTRYVDLTSLYDIKEDILRLISVVMLSGLYGTDRPTQMEIFVYLKYLNALCI
jgi:hypothetical protein